LSQTADGKHSTMLRKLLWSGLSAGIAAGATLAARRAAAGIWRLTTGDEPPPPR
jgi:hypothetical protein